MLLHCLYIVIGYSKQFLEQIHEILRARRNVEKQFDQLKVFTESILVNFLAFPDVQCLFDYLDRCLLIDKLSVFSEDCNHNGNQ